MFIDSARIFIKAGNGGKGAISFRREKYVPAGGPEGGDGGKGGNVIFIADKSIRTLADFRYKRKYNAQNGMNGEKSNRSGKSGEDIIIKVPCGTIIKDDNTNRVIVDMISDNQQFSAVKGGKGGKGNQHFATPTRQVPNFAHNGLPGGEGWIRLELKLLADVGLIGYPNVGKSTILSIVSSAKPKIADYHFTTLSPNLGVVRLKEEASFVIADIPGLIEGASDGAGLGHSFLRHIERTRILVHVIDVSGSEARNPLEDFYNINKELERYNSKLAERPQIIAANKMDVLGTEDNYKILKDTLEKEGHKVFAISAIKKEGIRELMFEAFNLLKDVPPSVLYDNNEEIAVYTAEKEEPFKISIEDGVYIIEGPWILKIAGSVNFGDDESLKYFQRLLKNNGVIEALYSKGIKQGDTVRIYDVEFDFIE